MQPANGVLYLLSRLRAEPRHADEAGHVIGQHTGEHDRILERLAREDDGQCVGFEARPSLETELHLRSLGTGQSQRDISRLHPGHRGVVDRGHPIAGLDSGFGRGAPRNHGQYGDGAVFLIQNRTDTRQIAALEFVLSIPVAA